jgi:hypothetical protein
VLGDGGRWWRLVDAVLIGDWVSAGPGAEHLLPTGLEGNVSLWPGSSCCSPQGHTTRPYLTSRTYRKNARALPRSQRTALRTARPFTPYRRGSCGPSAAPPSRDGSPSGNEACTQAASPAVLCGGRDRDRTCGFCRVKTSPPAPSPGRCRPPHHDAAGRRSKPRQRARATRGYTR